MRPGLFDASLTQAVHALDQSTQRQKVIASNIANRNTPGYRAMKVNFDDVMDGVGAKAAVPLKQTNAKHILPAGSSSSSCTVTEAPGKVKPNGNTVDTGHEMAGMVENNYRYQALLRSVNHQFRTLKLAIGGR